MIMNGLAGKPLPVYGKGLNVRDWLYVEDHARAIDVVVRRGRSGETYCVGGRNEWAKKGRVIALEKTSTLLANATANVLHFKTDATLPDSLVRLARITGRIVELPASGPDEIERHLATLRQAGVKAEDVEIRKADLEDVFIQLMNAPSDTGITEAGLAEAATA